MKISKRLNNINESVTIKMASIARNLKNQGLDVINLSIGEPDFEIPYEIRESAKIAIDQGYSKYTPISGYNDLKEAICNKFKRDNNIYYTTDQIVVSTGAKQVIYNILNCIIDEGDEVIIPAPYWVSYHDIIKLCGGIPIVIPGDSNNNYKVNLHELHKYINKKTKAFIYSSPCNPSGAVYSYYELKEMADFFSKYKDILIISDEIYEHIIYDCKHISIASFDKVYDQTITVNGMSKSYCMTGWRIGYMGGPKYISKACEKIQGQITSGANSIAQRASIVALNSQYSIISNMIMKFKHRRNLLYSLLKNIKGLKVNKPEGAFYIFVDISYYLNKNIGNMYMKNSYDFCMLLLNRFNIVVVPGCAFGMDNCIRISYTLDESKIINAVQKIKAFLYLD